MQPAPRRGAVRAQARLRDRGNVGVFPPACALLRGGHEEEFLLPVATCSHPLVAGKLTRFDALCARRCAPAQRSETVSGFATAHKFCSFASGSWIIPVGPYSLIRA